MVQGLGGPENCLGGPEKGLGGPVKGFGGPEKALADLKRALAAMKEGHCSVIDKEQNRQRSQLFVVARAILATAGLVGQGQLSKVATYGRPTVFFLDKSSLCMRQATAELPDWKR